jgi:hypothetical protein
MDTGHLNQLSGDPAADAVLAGYLTDLAGRLVLSRRRRADVVAEVADGLACAVDRRVEDGTSARDAAVAAVREFGDTATMAAAFNRQQLTVTGHRIGLGLVGTGPLVGLAWICARTDAGRDWPQRISETLSWSPLYPGVLIVSVMAALIAFAGAGPIARRITVPASWAATAAVVAATSCGIGDLSLIVSLAGGGDPTVLPAAQTVVAAAASMARLSVVALAGRRVLRLRVAAK